MRERVRLGLHGVTTAPRVAESPSEGEEEVGTPVLCHGRPGVGFADVDGGVGGAEGRDGTRPPRGRGRGTVHGRRRVPWALGWPGEEPEQ